MQRKERLSKEIKAEAERLGFNFCGICEVHPPLHVEIFSSWISEGMAADLEYLKRNEVLKTRSHPEKVLQKGKSVIVVGMHYSPVVKTEDNSDKSASGRIASYALHEDYHEIFRRRIRQFTIWLKDESSENVKFRVLVDSSAVPEKELAYFAGLGWIGRNSLLIHPTFGSFCLLGAIFTTLEIEPDSPLEGDICANCRACIDACPTGAINANRTVDARKCISYHTIENKGIVPKDLRERISNRVFGCDTCQIVCPANKGIINNNPQPSSLMQAVPPQVNPFHVLRLDQKAFDEEYGGTPLDRISLDLFQRNMVLAVGNIGSESQIGLLEKILDNHPSDLVRAHAAWAIGQIGSPKSKRILLKCLRQEANQIVRKEIASAQEKID